MAVDHLDNFNYQFFLTPSPPTRVGFGKVLIIAPLATNSLNGDDTRTYASSTEAAADLASGYIAQTTFDQVEAGFLQLGKPSGIKVGAVDLVGTETWGAAFTRILGADSDFYGVNLTSRTAADIVDVATVIEAEGTRQLFFQNGDADWLTTGVPAAFSTIDLFERSSLIYHDTATEYHDTAWTADRLSANPDLESADWKASLRGVGGLATALTTTQKGFLEDTNHGNVALPMTLNDPYFVDPGQNMAGRSIYETLSVDWYRTRTREDLALLFVQYAALRRKLVVGRTGQAAIQGILEKWLNIGANMESPHFIRGQTRVTPQDITQADRDTKQMRFKVEAEIAQSARTLSIDVFFQNSALEEA